MGKYTGRDVKIGIAKESTRGSATPSSYWIPRRDFDLDDKATVIIDNQGYGILEDSVNERVVAKWSEGSLKGIVRAKSIGLLLLNALGTSTPTSSSPVGGMWTHTLTVAQSHQHNSLTIEVDDPIIGDKAYALAMLNSLEIVADLNEFVIFNANFLARTATPTIAALTPSYVAEENFAAEEITIYTGDSFATLSATETEVKSVTLMIEKNIEKDEILGSVHPDDFLNKSLGITLTVEKTYETTKFKDSYLSASPIAARFKILQTSGGSPRSLTVDLNQVKITEWSVEKGLDDIMLETMTMKSNFKIADSRMVEIRLANTVSAY